LGASVALALTVTSLVIVPASYASEISARVGDGALTQSAKTKLAPPLTGMDLANAQLFVKQYGVEIKAKDFSKAKREVKYPEQWHIVKQSPAPGEKLRTNQKISVTVLKHWETIDGISALKAADINAQENSIMLNLVGLPLNEAYDRAEEQDIYIINEIDATGEDRSIYMKSNWTVIAQDAPPGEYESGVVLTVKKNGEVKKNDLQKTWVRQNWDVSSYYGKVTGYETDEYGGSNKANVVVVDATPVELDLIAPYPAACMNTAEDTTSQAVKKKELPVGTKVLAIYKETWSEIGFIHPLKRLDLSDIPRNSSNERLVLTGDWVPESYSFDDSALVRGETLVYEPRSDWTGYLTETEIPYALLILQAGSQVRATPVGGVQTCLAQVAAYQQKMAELRLQTEEAVRRWEIEYERRKAAGWYSCRDGDGDGVCHER
jgi:hypothetical protein